MDFNRIDWRFTSNEDKELKEYIITVMEEEKVNKPIKALRSIVKKARSGNTPNTNNCISMKEAEITFIMDMTNEINKFYPEEAKPRLFEILEGYKNGKYYNR